VQALTPPQRELAGQNVALVGFAIQRMGLTPDDDLVSAGYLGLIQAARAYRPERGRFSGYAVMAIRNEVSRHLKKQRTRQWSAEAPDTPDDRDPAVQVADTETASQIWSAVAKLPRRERRLILSVYRDGLAIHEAGRRIGLNGTTTQVHREALAALAVLLRTPT